ncbi:hypothetical protein NDK47_13965 [Brevibacillus ruminantium]|uniref:Uncharacterized protein n=1 Tax=Brevibacillus ruminantium TaxID=2950604 RepID=A0ABY4WC08_9BACL|nr:hypothetical protein [Brevibacillus ruminantium]USG63295.1 hypothetical protein NDK47_13965 [Brevibacillus ruminantium]
MRGGKYRGDLKEGHHRGVHDEDKGLSPRRGPKTFRRGRAIAFLENMNLKRSTIKQQLEEPEFQSIHQILVGELKAIDMVINEFIQLFEIHENEAAEIPYQKKEKTDASASNRETQHIREKGMDSDETNQ